MHLPFRQVAAGTADTPQTSLRDANVPGRALPQQLQQGRQERADGRPLTSPKVKIISLKVAATSRATSSGATPSARSPAASQTLTPATYSIVSTRLEDSGYRMSGTWEAEAWGPSHCSRMCMGKRRRDEWCTGGCAEQVRAGIEEGCRRPCSVDFLGFGFRLPAP